MEQLETLRLDSEPFHVEYESSTPTHLLIVILATYFLLLIFMMGLASYRGSLQVTVRH